MAAFSFTFQIATAAGKIRESGNLEIVELKSLTSSQNRVF